MSTIVVPQHQTGTISSYSPQNVATVLADHEDKLRNMQASLDQLKASALTKFDLKAVLREYDEEK